MNGANYRLPVLVEGIAFSVASLCRTASSDLGKMSRVLKLQALATPRATDLHSLYHL